MAKKLQLSSKKLQIDKAQATIVSVVAGAVFVAIFSLVSSKALWSQRSYQERVIAKQQVALDTLEKNISSVEALNSSYQQFVGSTTNMLGANPAGTGEQDGDNARLVLDALPSKYDFPALASSLDKILTDRKIAGTINGTDDELTQSGAEVSGQPVPVDIPFQLSVSGSYTTMQDLINVLERSIRPFNVQKISLSGGVGSMQMTLDVKTYFQPEKTLNIKKEVVK